MTFERRGWLLLAAALLAAGGGYSMWSARSDVGSASAVTPAPGAAIGARSTHALPNPPVTSTTRATGASGLPATAQQPAQVLPDADGVPRPVHYRHSRDSGAADPIPAADDLQRNAQAVLAEMRVHPEVFAETYGLELEDVRAIADGRKPLPVEMIR